jgi:glycosyltransferase involved in cell wall biosynthesis
LEIQVHRIARFLRRRYVLKIVGDTVWESARNQGRTCLDIDAFQSDAASQREWGGQLAQRNAYVHAATKIITPSEYLRRMVIGWGVEPARVVVIHNGVDFAENAGACAEAPLRNPSEPLRVLFVGRLTNWKGVETLLLAVKDLPLVELTVVGDGPAWPHLVAFKEQLGLGIGVKFTGRVSWEAARQAMSRHHLLVLTSLYEGLSHTLLEAGSLGLPCVASACGGNDEVIVHEKNGLLIPAQDVEALRRAIMRIEGDEAFRRELAADARTRSRRFDLERTVELYQKELG